MAVRTATKHTYRFTYDGQEYTRTTHRVYTHAIVLYMNSRYIASGNGKRESCEPYVAEVSFSSSLALAQTAMKKWHCHSVIVELEQPASA